MPRVLSAVLFITLMLFMVLPCVADDLDAVQKRGTLSFAMSGQYPPFNFVDANNRLTGFDVEICSEIAKRLGVEPQPLTIAWDGIIAGLLADRYDLICGSMAITEQRLRAIDFSRPYYRSGAQLFVGANSPVASVDDLEGKRIGVTLGTTYEEYVRANLPEVSVSTYRGDPAMILEVINGRIDGFITDRIAGARAISEKKTPIRLAGPLLYEERMGLALRQGNPRLKAAIDRELAAMWEDGTYRAISMRWLAIDAR